MHVKLILGRFSFDVITPSSLIPSLSFTSVCVARTSDCSSMFYHPPLANLEIVSVSFRVFLVIILRQRAPVNVQT